MTEAAKPALTQDVDEDARALARQLTRSSRYGSLAVLRPDDGFPAASRVLVATDFLGRPLLLVSGLSLHAKALQHDRRCSLLLGEPGKGDPLAHPRLSLFATADIIAPDAPERANLRHRFLARHPKAELYVDFPDFRFVRLDSLSASLNGGFARAYELEAGDLLDEATDTDLEAAGERARLHMNEDHGDAIDAIAAANGQEGEGWRIATVDRRGFEISRSDRLARIAFRRDPAGDGGYRKAFVDLVSDGAH
ncbi:MAG: pyridoxamine 5'-phosphate oxidase family protein [Pseudomonadota bacterium]|nr:pyridoxamine 5'-phosphate oxidase family protein [Pseudomonadota bacterium]